MATDALVRDLQQVPDAVDGAARRDVPDVRQGRGAGPDPGDDAPCRRGAARGPVAPEAPGCGHRDLPGLPVPAARRLVDAPLARFDGGYAFGHLVGALPNSPSRTKLAYAAWPALRRWKPSSTNQSPRHPA